jgi:hypothetical protein
MTIINSVPLSASCGISVTWKPVVCPCNLLKGLVMYLVCVDRWGGHVSEKQVTCCDVKYSNWKPCVRSVIWAMHWGLIHYHTKVNLLCYQLMMAGPQNHRTSQQIGM